MKTVSTLLLAGLALAAADTFPVIEENYDFVGNDVANVKGPADKCAEFCKANSNCHAYTWSNYQSGTCWLKSGRGEVKFTPGLKSAVMVQLPQKQCSLLADVDFIDNDLYNVPAKKAEDCCDLCKKLDRCRVYAWSDLNTGTCWLKSQLGTAIHKPGVKAGFAFPYDTPIKFFPNTDFEDHDIAAKPAAKPELCVDICTNYLGCRAFSWNNYQGGMCWLKAAQGKVLAKDGVTAAVINKPIAKAKFQDNTDFRDNDARNVQGIRVAEDCVQICADNSDCKAVVWTDYNGGTCWLKHQAGIIEPKDKAKAYTLQ